MEHFRYINVIRRANGRLRPWIEYNILAKYENYADDGIIYPMNGEKLKDREYEKRIRFQTRIQKICK